MESPYFRRKMTFFFTDKTQSISGSFVHDGEGTKFKRVSRLSAVETQVGRAFLFDWAVQNRVTRLSTVETDLQ